MSFEYKLQTKKEFSPDQKEIIIDLLKKNPFFFRTYIFDNKTWYEFRSSNNQDVAVMPDFSIIIENNGLYLCRNIGHLWQNLDKLKKILESDLEKVIDYNE